MRQTLAERNEETWGNYLIHKQTIRYLIDPPKKKKFIKGKKRWKKLPVGEALPLQLETV
jgi:hypothetical protein